MIILPHNIRSFVALSTTIINKTHKRITPIRISSCSYHNNNRCYRTTFSAHKSEAESSSSSSLEKHHDGDNINTQTDFSIYNNKNNIKDQILSAISADGTIKVTVCTVRNLINEVSMMHNMSKVPTDALGRLLVCSLLMSNGMQPEQTCQLSIDGDGPLRGVVAISTGKAEVRGYIGNSMLNGFSLVDAVGKGTVQVVKNHPDWPNPYNGITEIRRGDIDTDIGLYLAESEQRSCALAAGTLISGILCKSAGGYLVEQLPGCDKQGTLVKCIEQNLADLVAQDASESPPSNLFVSGITPLDMISRIFQGSEWTILGEMEPVYKCSCNSDRLLRSLRLLPKEEVIQIIAEQGMIEARCHFCGHVYTMEPDEMMNKLQEVESIDPSRDAL